MNSLFFNLVTGEVYESNPNPNGPEIIELKPEDFDSFIEVADYLAGN